MKRVTHFSAIATGVFTIATLPDPILYKDAIIIVSDGNSGKSVLCHSDGVSWIRSSDGLTPS